MTTFTVQGKGSFPVDMLRYDACWPADTESAELISQLVNGFGHELVTIRLRTNSKPYAITDGRWASFNWKVISKQ